MNKPCPGGRRKAMRGQSRGLPDNVEQDAAGEMTHSDCSCPLAPVGVWDEEMPEVLSCGGCGAIWHWQKGHWIEEEQGEAT